MEDRASPPPARAVAPEPGSVARSPVAFVGTGAAARSLVLALRQAGWPVAGIAGRDAPAVERLANDCSVPALGSPGQPGEALRQAPVVVLAVRDDAIRDVANRLARSAGPWAGRVALHLSGALPASEAEPLAAQGAAIASWHPLASLSGAPAASGIPFFVEGDEAARAQAVALTQALGGTCHDLPAGAKAAYHAAATLAGNLVAVLFAEAAEVLRGAGVARPEQALELLAALSLAEAARRPGLAGLTGPIARADAATLQANVGALGPAPASLRAAHAALSLAANARLGAGGRGEPSQRARIDELALAELRQAVADLTADAR